MFCHIWYYILCTATLFVTMDLTPLCCSYSVCIYLCMCIAAFHSSFCPVFNTITPHIICYYAVIMCMFVCCYEHSSLLHTLQAALFSLALRLLLHTCRTHLQVATVCHVLGLKPGWVVWVTFCPGQTGLTLSDPDSAIDQVC